MGGGDRKIQQPTVVAILRVFNGDQDFPRIRPASRKQLEGGRTLDQNTSSTLVTLSWSVHPWNIDNLVEIHCVDFSKVTEDLFEVKEDSIRAIADRICCTARSEGRCSLAVRYKRIHHPKKSRLPHLRSLIIDLSMGVMRGLKGITRPWVLMHRPTRIQSHSGTS